MPVGERWVLSIIGIFENRGEADGPIGRLPVWSLSEFCRRKIFVNVFDYKTAGTYPSRNLQLPPRSCPALKLPAGPDEFVRPRRSAGPVSFDPRD